MARRAIGRPTARRSYAADAKDGGALPMSAPRPRRSDAAVATDGGTRAVVCPSSKEEAVPAVSNDDGDDGTVKTSAFKAEAAGECRDGLGGMGEGESAWQVEDEAWLCDSGASIHKTPSADCTINCKRIQLKTAHRRWLNPLDRRIRLY